MISRLSLQYDRPAYLRSLAKRSIDRLIHPTRHRSDASRLKNIEAMESGLRAASDDQLRAFVADWRRQLRDRNSSLRLDEVIEPGFALVREASRRTLGLFHYPEQLLAGLILARGGISEMATGEGKTLAVSLPAFLFSLTGRGVHVVTVNSYLAERDFEFSRPLFEFLEISIGHLEEKGEREDKVQVYSSDIVYGVGSEFGFDYLRDQLALTGQHRGTRGERLRGALLDTAERGNGPVQRRLAFAIIDEVDSVLIDEAGSPLLISGPAIASADAKKLFAAARRVAEEMVEDVDFLLEEQDRRIDLTEAGIETAYRGLPVELRCGLRRPWTSYVQNALKARHLFERDIHYVVEDDKVKIVDEFTGRKFEERSWKDGQHQAVQSRESVAITQENEPAASITRQRFFRLYDFSCGLTGTAMESAGELWKFYQRPVETVPLHRPCQRKIFAERVFHIREEMFVAVVLDIEHRCGRLQPILIGTRTIESSEILAARLDQCGIEYSLLTAKQDGEEEQIVSEAGVPGRVTIATNMAGRGTHIDVGEAACQAGGLHVIAVERNESLRIDRQLFGRSARQGQPGSVQQFSSCEDFVLRKYGQEFLPMLNDLPKSPEGELPNSSSRCFDKAQRRAEAERYGGRIEMAKYDEWLDDTRQLLG